MSDLIKPADSAFSSEEAKADIRAVDAQDGPMAERREIRDSTAVAIANWHLDGKRRAMAALAAGQEVSIQTLHAEIAEVRNSTSATQSPFDRTGLDCLATWALNHPSRKPDPRDPLTMVHALMALQASVPYLGWDFERSEMDGYVDHTRIRVTIALTDEQGTFLRNGREMFAPKEN